MEDSAHTLLLRIFHNIPGQRMPGKILHKLQLRPVPDSNRKCGGKSFSNTPNQSAAA
jgi:hypothetical protein